MEKNHKKFQIVFESIRISWEEIKMTVQQQVANRVANLSEEGARLIDQMLNSMKTTFFVSNTSASKESGTFDPNIIL